MPLEDSFSIWSTSLRVSILSGFPLPEGCRPELNTSHSTGIALHTAIEEILPSIKDGSLSHTNALANLAPLIEAHKPHWS